MYRKINSIHRVWYPSVASGIHWEPCNLSRTNKWGDCKFSVGNLNPGDSAGSISGTGLSTRLRPHPCPSWARPAHVLNRLKDDAAAEEKPSPAWQVTVGRSGFVVARPLHHALLQGALAVLGVYCGSVHLLFMQTGVRHSSLITLVA